MPRTLANHLANVLGAFTASKFVCGYGFHTAKYWEPSSSGMMIKLERSENDVTIDDSQDDLGAEQFVRERSEYVEMMRRLCWMAATLYMYSTA